MIHDRREHLQRLGTAALGAAFAHTALKDAGACEVPLPLWLSNLYGNAKELELSKISSLQWQEQMDQLYGDVPLSQLLLRVQFDSLSKKIIDAVPEDRGELFHRIDLQQGTDPTGTEPKRKLVTKVAHIKKGRSIPPHGHSNMASAFLCISGEFEVRQYDKLEDRDDHLVVRQTVHDKAAGPGTWSSISDYRNNLHWLTAKTDDCFIFSSKLIGLENGRPLHGRINVDVLRGESLGSNTVRAKKITSVEAASLY